EDQHLPVGPDRRDVIALRRAGDHDPFALVQIEHLPAGPGLGGDRLRLCDEAARRAGRQQNPAALAVDDEHDRLGAAPEVDVQTQRLALAAPAGQALDRQQIAAAVAADQEQPVGALAVQQKARTVALLVLDLGAVLDVAPDHPDPALARAHDRDRLTLDRRLERLAVDHRSLAERGAPPPERPVAEAAADLLVLLAQLGPAQSFVLQQLLQLAPLGPERLLLLEQRLLFQATQIAQAHVEDRLGLALGQLERAHQLGLGFVLLADDADHLVEVE